MALVSIGLFHGLSVPKNPVPEVSPFAPLYFSCFVGYDICKAREKELSVRKRPCKTAEQWEGRQPGPCPGPTLQPLRSWALAPSRPRALTFGRPGTRHGSGFESQHRAQPPGEAWSRREESDLGWHSAAVTGHAFDAFNGFPGPLPSQASCHAKLADSWAARASLPQLVYCSNSRFPRSDLGPRSSREILLRGKECLWESTHWNLCKSYTPIPLPTTAENGVHA